MRCWVILVELNAVVFWKKKSRSINCFQDLTSSQLLVVSSSLLGQQNWRRLEVGPRAVAVAGKLCLVCRQRPVPGRQGNLAFVPDPPAFVGHVTQGILDDRDALQGTHLGLRHQLECCETKSQKPVNLKSTCLKSVLPTPIQTRFLSLTVFPPTSSLRPSFLGRASAALRLDWDQSMDQWDAE
jgi:hypothetical protein